MDKVKSNEVNACIVWHKVDRKKNIINKGGRFPRNTQDFIEYGLGKSLHVGQGTEPGLAPIGFIRNEIKAQASK